MASVQDLTGTILDFLGSRAITILLILILSYLLYRAAILLVDRFVRFRIPAGRARPENVEARKKVATVATLLKNVLKYLFFFFAGYLILLEVVGPERRLSLITGAGVMGIVLGLGAQSLLRDVISGFFIVFEGQFKVGDFVRLQASAGNLFGTVADFGLRTTTLRGLDGSLHFLANGNIRGVQRYPKGYETVMADLRFSAASEEEKVRSGLEVLSEKLGTTEPFLLDTPELVEVIALPASRVFRLKFFVAPAGEGVANKLVDGYATELESMGLEKPTGFPYKLDDEELKSYRSILRKT